MEKASRTNYKISFRGKHMIYHTNLLRKWHDREGGQPVYAKALEVENEVDSEVSSSVRYHLST